MAYSETSDPLGNEAVEVGAVRPAGGRDLLSPGEGGGVTTPIVARQSDERPWSRWLNDCRGTIRGQNTSEVARQFGCYAAICRELSFGLAASNVTSGADVGYRSARGRGRRPVKHHRGSTLSRCSRSSHWSNMSALSMQSWKPACRILTVLSSEEVWPGRLKAKSANCHELPINVSSA